MTETELLSTLHAKKPSTNFQMRNQPANPENHEYVGHGMRNHVQILHAFKPQV